MAKDINNHPLLAQLTDKQKLFITKYIETQDKLAAVKHAAYDCRDDRTSAMMAHRNFKHPIIKQLLAEALGYQPSGGILTRKELLLLASEGARKVKRSSLQISYMQIVLILQGWVDAPSDLKSKVAHQLKKMELARAKKG